jgi:regulator of sigma E protease
LQEFIHTVGYTIVPFVLVLSLLVFIHELGHYLVARYNKVRIEAFSIGFGPEIFGWTDGAGTRWKVCYVPLGGYVKMFSDLNAASQPDQQAISQMSEADKEASLFHKTVWQRIAVSVAGPMANYLFAIVVLSGLYMTVGQRVPAEVAKVGQVMKDTAADRAGLKTDDIITNINGEAIHLFSEMQTIVRARPGEKLAINVMRDGVPQQLEIAPDNKGGTGILGISQGVDTRALPFYSAPFAATADALKISWATLSSFGRMLTGQQSAEGLSGPIGIARITSQAAQQGAIEVIWLSAFLSICLGLINLLPVPMLDGGHLLFYTIEAVRGKPVGEKAQEIGYKIGFALIICLVLFSTWNDIGGAEIVDKVKKFFN